jgi:hypothetical protein
VNFSSTPKLFVPSSPRKEKKTLSPEKPPFELKIFFISNIDFIHKWHQSFLNRKTSIVQHLKLYQIKIKSINMLQMSSSSSDYDRQKNNNNSSGRSSRNKKKGAPFMFLSNILKKKKILGFEEIREMNTRTRSEPSGESNAPNALAFASRNELIPRGARSISKKHFDETFTRARFAIAMEKVRSVRRVDCLKEGKNFFYALFWLAVTSKKDDERSAR